MVSLPYKPAQCAMDLPDLRGFPLVLALDNAGFAGRTAQSFEKRGAKVYVADEFETVSDELQKAGPNAVVILGLNSAEENAAAQDALRREHPGLRILLLDPTRGTPKGMMSSDLYVSYRYPMHHSDVLRGISMLAGVLKIPADGEPSVGAAGKHAETRHISLANLSVARTGAKSEIADAPANHILVIEDNPLNLSVLSRQLNILGVSFETAEDGQQGLEKWRAGKFDAILTDCQMPVMDGLEMTRQIRQDEAEQGLDAIPILAISASALPQEAERSLEAGISQYLTKPLRIETLSDCLKLWLPMPDRIDAPRKNVS